ncbi:MAG: hypothetical protein Q4D99_05380, partial [Bacillota bacterium]|nr:hypothetical protein [Bacillota bacterium]
QQQADVRMQPQYAQQVQYAQAQPQYGQPQAAYGVEKPSKLWGLLGGCVPIAGLILFLVWKDKQPHNAKYAGIGAIIGFVVGIISYIILQVCLAAMYSYY